jgi:hypothetical protein
MNNSRKKQEQFDLYAFQRRTLPVLLGWAVGSIVAGGFWWRSSQQWLRGLGSQFLGWGLIDGLIALFGLRSARANATKYSQEEISKSEMHTQTQRFEQILWANTGLDIGYLLFGSWILNRARGNDQRTGIGWGIIFQGGFLFIWDLLLLLLLRSK